MKLEVLARAVAVMLQMGYIPFSFVEQQAFKPFSCDAFLENVALPHRCFSLQFLATVLESIPEDYLPDSAVPWLLRMWLRSSVDFGGRLCFAYFTMVLTMRCSTQIFFSGANGLGDLLGDSSGEACAHLVQKVSGHLRNYEGADAWIQTYCDRLDKVCQLVWPLEMS